MKLTEYLEHLTENNWHTLRHLIELEQNALDEVEAVLAWSAYLRARDYLHSETAERFGIRIHA
jgi:type II secretory pathway predicted ATPase ExeA